MKVQELIDYIKEYATYDVVIFSDTHSNEWELEKTDIEIREDQKEVVLG